MAWDSAKAAIIGCRGKIRAVRVHVVDEKEEGPTRITQAIPSRDIAIQVACITAVKPVISDQVIVQEAQRGLTHKGDRQVVSQRKAVVVIEIEAFIKTPATKSIKRIGVEPHGFIALRLKNSCQCPRIIIQRHSPVGAMLMRKQACKNGSERGKRPGRSRYHILKQYSARRETVQVGSGRPAVAIAGKMVRAHGVESDEHNTGLDRGCWAVLRGVAMKAWQGSVGGKKQNAAGEY